MSETLLSWEQRLFEELEKGTDLLCLDVLGTQFAVRWGGAVTRQQRQNTRSAWARCADDKGQMLPPLPAESTAAQPFSAAVAYKSLKHDGGAFQLQAASFEELAENLTSRLTVAAILANAGDLIMLHACGVADPATGALVALVAKSGTGKTTAAAMLARIYGYVTDETVAICPDGSVVPYPKPLSVKQLSGPKRQVGPDELGLLPAPAKPYLQAIVLLDRVKGGYTSPVLKRVPLADAVLALIPESSSLGELQDPLQSLCRLIDSVGGVWQLTYSEAADLPPVLEPLLKRQRRSKQEWEALPRRDSRPGYLQPEPIPPGWVRCAAAKDVVAIGEDLLLMLDSQIVRLSGTGPAIWKAAASPTTVEQLTEEVGKLHGTPEGYRDAVAAATAQLFAQAVLEQGSE